MRWRGSVRTGLALGLFFCLSGLPVEAQDSLNVRRLDYIRHVGWTMEDVVVKGGLAYYTCWQYGLRIANVADPQNIFELPPGSPPC